MKKLLAVLLLFSCAAVLIGCGTDQEAFCTTRNDNGAHVLIVDDLPDNVQIIVPDENLPYVSQIDRELFASAYETLLSFVKADSTVEAYVSQNADGYLVLSADVITMIDPPNVSEHGDTSGCGIDHEHNIVYQEISQEPASAQNQP